MLFGKSQLIQSYPEILGKVPIPLVLQIRKLLCIRDLFFEKKSYKTGTKIFFNDFNNLQTEILVIVTLTFISQ